MTNEDLKELGLVPGGRFVNRYEVVRKLGAGGMGMVFEVLDTSLNRERLAMKIFSPPDDEEDSSSLLTRFRNEVRITRKLTHPNIVRTYDFAELPNGIVYMTMEFVDGNSLDQVLKENLNGRMDIDRAVRVLTEIAEGMEYAHAHGVVHRDLKPGNVLMSHLGQVKITDFGLAQSMACRERLTMTGECVGTPAYMSPEQVLGKQADQRSDIYAIGMIAYELCMGDVPFRKKGWFELANQIVNEPIPPFADEKPDIPGWYESLVLKATEKDPLHRFDSVKSLYDAIVTKTVVYEQAPLNITGAEDFLAESSRMTRVSTRQLAPLPSFSKVPSVAAEEPKSIQVSLTIPSKPSSWFLAIAVVFLISSIGLRNFLFKTNQAKMPPIIIQSQGPQTPAPSGGRRAADPGPLLKFDEGIEQPTSNRQADPATLADLTAEDDEAPLARLLTSQIEEARRNGVLPRLGSPAQRQKAREVLQRRRQAELQQRLNQGTQNADNPADFPRGYRSLN